MHYLKISLLLHEYNLYVKGCSIKLHSQIFKYITFLNILLLRRHVPGKRKSGNFVAIFYAFGVETATTVLMIEDFKSRIQVRGLRINDLGLRIEESVLRIEDEY